MSRSLTTSSSSVQAASAQKRCWQPSRSGMQSPALRLAVESLAHRPPPVPTPSLLSACRFANAPAAELQNAAIEQMKITELRLAKLFGPGDAASSAAAQQQGEASPPGRGKPGPPRPLPCTPNTHHRMFLHAHPPPPCRLWVACRPTPAGGALANHHPRAGHLPRQACTGCAHLAAAAGPRQQRCMGAGGCVADQPGRPHRRQALGC